MQSTIETISDGDHLSRDEARDVADWLISDATDAQIAGLLVGLRAKGITPDELAGFATGLRDHCVRIHPETGPLVDTCGTGGDGPATFNVSTTSALVAAGMGVSVAKHGNRAISSSSGSSDVLEQLGFPLDTDPTSVVQMLTEHGFGYLHAPSFHPAMRSVASVRGELGFRTIFNLLGPLTNPAGATRQVLGVYDDTVIDTVAGALSMLDTDHALVVHGSGIDEIAVHGTTKVAEVRSGRIERYELTPEHLGVDRAPIDEIQGGSPRENALLTRSILSGERTDAYRDITLVNAGATAYVGGLTGSITEGIELAAQAIDDGRASRLLERITGEVVH